MKALLVSIAIVASAPILDKPPVIKEWPVPWADTRPRDPYLDPTTNRIWFCGQAGNYLAYFVPTTGEFKKYELPPGSGPHNLIVDKTGMLWYSATLAGYIGRLDPKDGSIKQYPIPDRIVRDPHTPVFDKNGDIWFTAQVGNADRHLTVAGGPDARPYAMVRDDEDRVWVVETSRPNRFVSFDARTLQFSEETQVPSGGGVVRHMFYDPKSKSIWFGTDNNTIGQAIVPARTPAPQTP